jgi:RHS repeat-associated protein
MVPAVRPSYSLAPVVPDLTVYIFLAVKFNDYSNFERAYLIMAQTHGESARVRYLDPSIGRWTTRDNYEQFTPAGLNKYQDCENNPLRFVDPMGTDDEPYMGSGGEDSPDAVYVSDTYSDNNNNNNDNNSNNSSNPPVAFNLFNISTWFQTGSDYTNIDINKDDNGSSVTTQFGHDVYLFGLNIGRDTSNVSTTSYDNQGHETYSKSQNIDAAHPYWDTMAEFASNTYKKNTFSNNVFNAVAPKFNSPQGNFMGNQINIDSSQGIKAGKNPLDWETDKETQDYKAREMIKARGNIDPDTGLPLDKGITADEVRKQTRDYILGLDSSVASDGLPLNPRESSTLVQSYLKKLDSLTDDQIISNYFGNIYSNENQMSNAAGNSDQPDQMCFPTSVANALSNAGVMNPVAALGIKYADHLDNLLNNDRELVNLGNSSGLPARESG